VHDAIDVATFEAERQRMREISRMDHAVRSRFNHGIRYNMKVIMRGSKGVPGSHCCGDASRECLSRPM
jgi:hypothetical protein